MSFNKPKKFYSFTAKGYHYEHSFAKGEMIAHDLFLNEHGLEYSLRISSDGLTFSVLGEIHSRQEAIDYALLCLTNDIRIAKIKVDEIDSAIMSRHNIPESKRSDLKYFFVPHRSRYDALLEELSVFKQMYKKELGER